MKCSIRAVYEPSQEIVVDEAMIPFQGRSSIKQYMKSKPVKRGIKVWCLADSANGYIANFDVYTGKGEEIGENDESSLGARVVISLSSHLQGINHHLYCGNFFSSPYLFQKLLSMGIYANGTLRLNMKGSPPDLKIPSKGEKKPPKLGLISRLES